MFSPFLLFPRCLVLHLLSLQVRAVAPRRGHGPDEAGVGELRVAAGVCQPGKGGGQLWLWTQFWNRLYKNRIMLRSQELYQVLKKFLSLLHQDTQQPEAMWGG